MVSESGRARSDRRILMAGDFEATSPTLLDTLRESGFAPVTAATGAEAWNLFRDNRFASIVSHLSLPGLDALELLQRVRGSDDSAHTYFIVVGDLRDTAGLERSISAGADDFLYGPVGFDELLVRLRVSERLAKRIERMREDIATKNRTLSEANEQLEAANRRMRRDLEAAARVQKVLLPKARPMVRGLDIAWRFRPTEELAGDILNCFQVDEHNLAFYVLDVSGHGVSSALLSVQVARMMSPMMSESELLKQRLDHAPWYRVVEPAEVVSRLNQLFQVSGESTKYFTIIYGLMELSTGRLRFVSAGHPSPLHVPAGGDPVPIVCHGHPVGLFEAPMLDEAELTMQPGDRLWLYSDGVSEVRDGSGEMLGLGGLARKVADLRDEPLDSSADQLLRSVERWCLPATPDDDCSLLAIERLATQPS